ncbi:MAG TPA: ATP-dependent DNA helicase RecG [Candidatus Magasanikbacteria bacterium]|nr:ATP-dependent DNA helicase RecG [Candidatus Magasanikbacteria bacterium]
MVNLSTPLSQFPTVKKALSRKLHSLGLIKAQDLLYYFPFRYDDYSQTVAVKNIIPDVPLTVFGRLQLLTNRRSFARGKMVTEGIVADETGQVKVIWFNQPYLIKNLQVGDEIFLAGKAELNKYGLQLVNPVYEKARKNGNNLNTGRLVPVYSTTSGLSQKQIRFLLSLVLEAVPTLSDWLPEEISRQFNFLSLAESLREVHFPTAEEKFLQAKNRFQLEELLLIQLRNEKSRLNLLNSQSAGRLKFNQEAVQAFVNHLPFQLTPNQKTAAWEILQDLEKVQPMNRLLDGDVGSGKTVVAVMTCLNCAVNGYQAALMAPTEILANQHFETLSKLLEGFPVKIALLTSKQYKFSARGSNPGSKKELVEKIKAGEVDLIVGTQSLIAEKLKFKKLGLVIVDEQHRFGVAQRHKIQTKGRGKKQPHFLSMTATPIPRSYALSLYGDLDLSLIKHKPLDRKPIITKLVEEINRQKAYDFIRQQVVLGRQIFVVCPLIEDKKNSDKKSVLTEYQKLSQEIFPDLRVNYLHGKMLAKEKEELMNGFLNKDFDILISTSVVEVGVDVPNASVIMIEGAERFGLAQLHQFRGRVGRSSHQSYCLLFSGTLGSKTKQRLQYFTENEDGFSLAEKDLEMRGPGEVFGTNQHGFPELKIADLSDLDLVKKSREIARTILKKDPSLDSYPLLKEKIKDWEKTIHWE